MTLGQLLTTLGCMFMRHPRKRITYWLVKAVPNGAYSSGWTSNPLGGSSGTPDDGPAFAVITFECPDCKRRWSTELS